MEILGAVSSCLTLAEVSLKTVSFLHDLAETQDDFADLKEQITMIDLTLKGFQRTHGFFPQGLSSSRSPDPSLFTLATNKLQSIKNDLDQIKSACQRTQNDDLSNAKKRKWALQRHKLPKLYEKARDLRSSLQFAMELEIASMMASYREDLKRYHSDIEFIIKSEVFFPPTGIIKDITDEPLGTSTSSDDSKGDVLSINYDSNAALNQLALYDSHPDVPDHSSLVSLYDGNSIDVYDFKRTPSFSFVRCQCWCHSSQKSNQAPAAFRKLLESLTYSRISSSTGGKCSYSNCKCPKDRWIEFQFRPPRWLWARSVLFKATYGISGLNVALRPARVLSATDDIWAWIEKYDGRDHNLEKLSTYFPDDADEVQGGLLEYAINFGSFNTIELFLGIWGDLLSKKGPPRQVVYRARHELGLKWYDSRERKLLEKIVSLADDVLEVKLSAVHDAARRGNGMSEALDQEGGAIDELDHTGKAPLHIACLCGNSEVVKQLIDAKANIDVPDYIGWTPIMFAARDNELDCMRLLLEAHCNVEQRNDSFDTALQWATDRANHEAVALLLAAGASVSTRGLSGRTPLHSLAECPAGTDTDRIQRIVDLLRVARNFDIDVRDNEGLTPVMYALMHNNLPLVRSLVDAGANLHSLTRNSRNILHLAAEYCDIDVLRYLQSLELRSIDVGHRDKFGYTPKADLLYCSESSLWDLGTWRNPSRAERRAFGRLCKDIRNRNIHEDIRISNLAIELLRKLDSDGARAQLSLIINQKPERRQHDTVSWYRAIDKMIQVGEFNVSIEELVEYVEDMLATVGTSFWDTDDDASSDSSQTEDHEPSETDCTESGDDESEI